MDKLQNLNQLSQRALTSERILGIPELEIFTYNDIEVRSIKQELIRYAASKNEVIPFETVNCWLMDFQELRMTVTEVIKRIRLAKLDNKFGATDFAAFMNVRLSDYSTHYKHEHKEQPETRVKYDESIMGYGTAVCKFSIKEFPNITKDKEYVIIDEYIRNNMHDKNILLRDDSNVTAFYPAEYFKLKQ